MTQQAVLCLPVARITCRPQVREAFDDESLTALAQSIREVGLQQPIRVRSIDGGWVMIDGERRLRAVRDQLGWAEIPAIVDEVELSEPQVVQRQLICNLQRDDLSPVEKARAIERLVREAGWSAAEVAQKLGLSPATISRLRALLVLPSETQERVSRGELAASTAYEIASTRDGTLREQLIAAARQGTLTRERVTRRTRSARRERPRQRRSRHNRTGLERVVFDLGDRNSITVAGRGLTVSASAAWIEQLLGRLRSVGAAAVNLRDAAVLLGARRQEDAP